MIVNVYADVVLSGNFVMDYILLSFSGKLLGLEERRGGRLLAASAGACYALFFLLCPFMQRPAAGILSGILAAWGMTEAAFVMKGVRSRIQAVCGLYLAAVAAAGCSQWICTVIPGLQAGWIPISALLGTGTAGALLKTAARSCDAGCCRCRAVLSCGGREAAYEALVDTGNHLTDPYWGRPVNILSPAEGEWLKGSDRPCVLIPYRTVGCPDGLLRAFRADWMEVETGKKRYRVKRPVIGIAPEHLSQNRTYQMLLNEKFWM